MRRSTWTDFDFNGKRFFVVVVVVVVVVVLPSFELELETTAVAVLSSFSLRSLAPVGALLAVHLISFFFFFSFVRCGSFFFVFFDQPSFLSRPFPL